MRRTDILGVRFRVVLREGRLLVEYFRRLERRVDLADRLTALLR
jgi:hypothetical protein